MVIRTPEFADESVMKSTVGFDTSLPNAGASLPRKKRQRQVTIVIRDRVRSLSPMAQLFLTMQQKHNALIQLEFSL